MPEGLEAERSLHFFPCADGQRDFYHRHHNTTGVHHNAVELGLKCPVEVLSMKHLVFSLSELKYNFIHCKE